MVIFQLVVEIPILKNVRIRTNCLKMDNLFWGAGTKGGDCHGALSILLSMTIY
jgi:hypothetical protein